MNELCQNAVRFLEETYDADRALFPSSTRLANGGYRSEYDPVAVRYTLACLVGLAEAARHDGDDPFLNRIDAVTNDVLARHAGGLSGCADLGLLTVLAGDGYREDALRRIRVELRERPASLTMQDLGWVLWGAARAGAEDVAQRAFDLVRAELVDSATGLPRHTARKYRRHVVSFGSISYYLQALHEFAAAFGSDEARTMFVRGVERVLALQGPNGEWPWLIRPSTGAAVDVYPVFSVHQLSMAMLFLHPALDAVPGTREAIERSVAWVRGANQLGLSLVNERPFFVYRSLQRREALPRARRYMRSIRRSPSTPLENEALAINRESRSYEWGWILYVWSGRNAEDV